ncbi:MAG: SAM-dependent methyltransferase [Zetaproteobacteria bacterium CG12_big_fil_rev_8_21_14_0_65_54_13]|nr:MAG: SAM-dependent methyltransferase [Zetaproteobacteria bacterium CG23_combo_of_CG06-09_8_20_14_all_54_7]PIW44365.1 MAG: SAM-dependent methyltransferase [Zetaproteobacteria bacterium CG12_big_fil_rev_8_21_14_0_65_54_13]PIX55092.1 MAG: SAM-dependent methyltransferase [Zetaproteobacteria bacterium CG_4_10_14_3_um_filter_54_28]PJA30190.1 MAG: SAM-dependent methyltransferase [Zetaproteobacteria bacterium CG_4_9_14_3_um_filter_54_145]
MNCRHCGKALQHQFLDLGFAPPSNAYLNPADLHAPELYFPLKLHVCDDCWLVQTEDYARSDELFTEDYAYFSSTSSGWMRHAREYCGMISDRLHLNEESFVIEVASNDGYLLRNFVAAGVPCLGVEPTDSTADAAEQLNIPVIRKFFGQSLAEQLVAENKQADLILGNNVYAHVPDINDFTMGLKTALKPGGTITLEFPHLLNLIQLNQFDTVYHEHYSYLSLYSVQRIFERAGLVIYDVEQLPTHGGSLRIYGCHADAGLEICPAVEAVLAAELAAGMRELDVYLAFQPKADRVKNDLLQFLIEQKLQGKTVAAYGAAAKGNTLLNYAGVRPDLLSFVCDAAAAKQGKYMPGSHIPILAPEAMARYKPDFVVILPWNISEEVMRSNVFVREWGGQFVTAVPELKIQ